MTSKNNHRIVGASTLLKFADGTEYDVSPLTDKDIEELNEWVRARFIQNVRGSLPEDISDEKYKLEMGVAYAQAAGIGWMSGVGASMMATPHGLARLLLQGLKEKHPSVTLDDLRSHMFDPKNIEESRRVFHRLNVGDKEVNSKRRKKQKLKRGKKR